MNHSLFNPLGRRGALALVAALALGAGAGLAIAQSKSDPKAALALVAEAIAAIAGATTTEELRAVASAVTGKRSTLAEASRALGQAAPEERKVLGQRLVGERHLKLSLRVQGHVRDGIWFGHTEPLPARAQMAYRVSLDEFQGRQRVQVVVEGVAD